ncbi:unnamed protein product [Miscanthus lutarioriparius]|uniref:Uncharacterized protein n=1 Tax=Miscanthus lutarioriparius TaxID=422564 RepID=A0A811PIQ3_9POAL|nr:unnamed protein product [Miscanthus lutarioriparius]
MATPLRKRGVAAGLWPFDRHEGSVAIRSIAALPGPACSVLIKRECELRQEFDGWVAASF